MPSSYTEDATFFYNFGLVSQKLKKYQQALNYLQNALAINQKFNGDSDEQGLILSQIGIVYRKLGKQPQAIAAFNRAEEISFLLRMFGQAGTLKNIGLSYYESGKYPQALDFYQKAVVMAQKIGDRESEAIGLNNIGVVHEQRKEYPKAIAFYQQALAIFQELDQKQELENNQAMGVILNNIGATYHKLGKYLGAIDPYQRALAIFQEATNLEPLILPNSPIAIKAQKEIRLYQQGVQEFKQGEYLASLKRLQQALAIARDIGNKQREWINLNQIGLVYSSLGEYKFALDFFEQALAIPKQIFQNNGAIHYNIAGVYSNLGNYTKALEFYRKALALTQKRGYKEGEVQILNRMGIVYFRQREYEIALDSYQQALEIIKTIDTDKKLLEGATLYNIGYVYLYTEKHPFALDLFQQSLTIYQQFGSKYSTVQIINAIGQAYSKLGNYEIALDFLQQGLVIAQEIGAKESEGNILKNIGYLLEKQNQPELAIVFLKQSINTREIIRNTIKGLSQELQQSYIEVVADDYRALANLLLKHDRVIEAQQVLDLLKVQELDEYLRNVRGNRKTEQGIEYLPKEQELLTQYTTKLTQLIQLGKELEEIQKIPPQKRTNAQEKRRQEIETAQLKTQREYLNFINSQEIVSIVQQLNQNTGGEALNPKTLIQLQNDLKKLGQDAVLLYPVILDDRIELVLVTPYAPPIRRSVAVKKEDFNRAIAQFRSALTQPNKRIFLKPAQTTGKQLYDWLIKPTETALTEANAKTIIYAPDGQLRYIPLAALYDGNQWLVQKYRINNITAVSLTNLGRKPKSVRVLAGAFTQGNYDFQIGNSHFSFRGLPFAAQEVETLARTIPDTTQILNSNFSKSEILTRMRNYSILHFATHAAFVTGQPEESFILFGNGDKANFRDVETWTLANTDLVVLSACETGVGGKLGDGREILGFGYLVQQAGAKASMASLWAVDDRSTQILMNSFYATLTKKNTTKAEALRQAQIALISGDYSGLTDLLKLEVEPQNDGDLSSQVANQFSHPYYWSSFILIGNGL
jgi:CHAT domain-containing protein/Tfp pilus assembly protein PilF